MGGIPIALKPTCAVMTGMRRCRMRTRAISARANPAAPLRFMYYDDEGRRFNLVTGLLFGTLLGAGLALLVSPQQRLAQHRLPKARAVRRTARRVKRGTEGAMDSLRGKLMEAVTASISEAWKGAK